MIDDRISELARTNTIVHAGIRSFVDAGISEKETLVRLVIVLAEANQILFDELLKLHQKIAPMPIVVHDKDIVFGDVLKTVGHTELRRGTPSKGDALSINREKGHV